MNPQQRQTALTALLFLAPFIATLVVFFLYAFVRALYFSFTNYDLFDRQDFVGLSNYTNIFTDRLFRAALTNTLLFAFITTVSQTVLALLMANVLNQKVRGIGFFRTAWYMPSITSSVVIGLIFLWIFQRRGLANYLLTSLANHGAVILTFLGVLALVQITQVVWERARRLPAAWTDPALAVVSALVSLVVTALLLNTGVVSVGNREAVDISYYATSDKLLGILPVPLATVIVQNVFTTVPTLMLFFLAGLQNIPRALYEAAEIDGASKLQQLLYVTVPMLRPVSFYVVTVGLIGTLQMFDQVAIIGNAAPIESIVTLAYYVYSRVFSGGASEVGLAMAGAMILAGLTLLFVTIQRRFFVSDEAYS